MSAPQTLQSRLGSVYVTSAFLDSFVVGLSFNIAMMIGSHAAHTGGGFHLREVHPAFALAAVLGAAHDICAQVDITDEESLVDMLDTIRRQFGAVDDCNESDSRLAMETLKHVFGLAERAARQTLVEVSAGFPVSKGSFPRWKEELRRRAHGS